MKSFYYNVIVAVIIISIADRSLCLLGLGGDSLLSSKQSDDSDDDKKSGTVDTLLKSSKSEKNNDKQQPAQQPKKEALDTKGILKSVNLDLLKLFGTFKKEYKKSYASRAEEEMHYKIFESNTKEIKKFNEQKRFKYLQEINEFTDLAIEDILKGFAGFSDSGDDDGDEDYSGDGDTKLKSALPVDRPKTWDWRQYGIVNDVRHQHKCGSCWSFAATCVLESHSMKMQIIQGKFDPKKPLTASEQNLVDCAQAQGASGCSGGMPHQGWKYVIANDGIDTEESYKYESKETGACKYDKKNKAEGIRVDGHKKIPEPEDDLLEQAIYEYGPVAVAIHVTKTLPKYKGGIFSDPKCDPKKVNHAVVAIGYGEEKGEKFFILKNSWGAKWGEKGFMRLSRSVKNNCGIATKCYYPIIAGMKDTSDVKELIDKAKL